MKKWARFRLAGIAALSLLSMLTLAACGGAGSKSNADLLKEAATNMKSVKSYHLDANVTQDTQQVTIVGDFDLANNNAKMDINAAGQAVNVITVGSDVYLSMDGGTTYTNAGASGASITSGFSQFTGMWDSFKTEDVDKAKDALKDGTPATDKVDGVDVKHIMANAKDLAIMAASGGGTTEGTLEFWVGPDAKPYIYKMAIDGTSDGKPIKGTFTWTKFDQDMNITAPPTNSNLNTVEASR